MQAGNRRGEKRQTGRQEGEKERKGDGLAFFFFFFPFIFFQLLLFVFFGSFGFYRRGDFKFLISSSRSWDFSWKVKMERKKDLLTLRNPQT